MIHIFDPNQWCSQYWQVWTDPDALGLRMGHCIGHGETKKIALQDAKASLEEDLRYVNEQLEKEN